ncbi:uncharacterized protein LOC143038462 [Oratosquilla oratoria]|uniref:uncharacterized protein LOC143038462 n=1 Tax=Oratosquilla oratoria TaxID=337810 RepID=UPI003F761A0E
MMDRYRTPEERYPSREPEPDYDYTPRHTRAQLVDVELRSLRVPRFGAASPSERAYLLGAASAKFITVALVLGISIYLEVEMYYVPGYAAVATFVSVGGVAFIMSFIAAGANTEILHIASLALSAASAFISIFELIVADGTYWQGQDISLVLIHIVPFDVCTGVILLGIQGAIVVNIWRQRNEKNNRDLNTNVTHRESKRSPPQYIRRS